MQLSPHALPVLQILQHPPGAVESLHAVSWLPADNASSGSRTTRRTHTRTALHISIPVERSADSPSAAPLPQSESTAGCLATAPAHPGSRRGSMSYRGSLLPRVQPPCLHPARVPQPRRLAYCSTTGCGTSSWAKCRCLPHGMPLRQFFCARRSAAVATRNRPAPSNSPGILIGSATRNAGGYGASGNMEAPARRPGLTAVCLWVIAL